MTDSLGTFAETKAKESEMLVAFSGLNLLGIKIQIGQLLSLIGRVGLFDEYTRHDISHINSMLKSLDWLVPDRTKASMSPTDWLTIVLAIYFHDLGMLVTHKEYDNRASSGFFEYRDTDLLGGENSADYAAQVAELPDADAERFLYQEFVRHRHAERIRDWIMGRSATSLGVASDAAGAVDEVLKNLHPQYRRDLGLICESHHLDNLGDLNRYKVNQPYGNSKAETVNLQYAALLLRTADLLDITSDRAPSIVFKAVSPANPFSQLEWAKQNAVTSVRPKLGIDRDGVPSETAARDTIEVHAYFRNTDGFFGLTSYLSYAADQLRKSYTWAKQAEPEHASRYEFPWRYLDDKNIETEGFLRDTYEFTIDQAKILDLLTGHTLYNDTQIVIRELIQNSLDAIRLQRLMLNESARAFYNGLITVRWNSQLRLLSVQDNGTGISQESIEQHLLKVGSSRYQDPEFKKEYPNFSPISRFGIGLLSVFMVADEVEIITSSPLDASARQLSLRSVQGRYLIILLDKEIDKVATLLSPHGTLIRLKVRRKADMADLISAIKKWVVVPECEVLVQVDTKDPIKIGFPSPREALIEALRTGVSLKLSDDSNIKIEEKTVAGVTVAYALEWSEFFREWTFLDAQAVAVRSSDDEADDGISLGEAFGTCVEGIRVEFDTPGFGGRNVVAIANATGLEAPKTNVVRSGLEATRQRDEMLSAIYSIYVAHIEKEMTALQERKFSLTWATHEARYLLAPLVSRGRGGRNETKPISSELLVKHVRDLPLFIVEVEGRRLPVSANALGQMEHFWTVDGAFFRSAETLLREITGPVSLASLANVLQSDTEVPDGAFLSDVEWLESSWSGGLEGREVDKVLVIPEQRRIDLRWGWRSEPPRWHLFQAREEDVANLIRSSSIWMDVQKVFLRMRPVEMTGLTSETAIRGFNGIYLVTETPLTTYLTEFLKKTGREDKARRLASGLLAVIVATLYRYPAIAKNKDYIGSELERPLRELSAEINFDEVFSVAARTVLKMFDPAAWKRQ